MLHCFLFAHLHAVRCLQNPNWSQQSEPIFPCARYSLIQIHWYRRTWYPFSAQLLYFIWMFLIFFMNRFLNTQSVHVQQIVLLSFDTRETQHPLRKASCSRTSPNAHMNAHMNTDAPHRSTPQVHPHTVIGPNPGTVPPAVPLLAVVCDLRCMCVRGLISFHQFLRLFLVHITSRPLSWMTLRATEWIADWISCIISATPRKRSHGLFVQIFL